MQITWNGRDGKRGQDKSILTIPMEVALEGQMGRNLVLKAGINDGVTEADWKKAQEIELVRWYIEQGNLEELKADTLLDFTIIRACQMPKETIDMNLLNKWRKAEYENTPVRQEVIAAIEKQMADMTTIPTKQPEKQKQA